MDVVGILALVLIALMLGVAGFGLLLLVRRFGAVPSSLIHWYAREREHALREAQKGMGDEP